ncbi:MAG: zinc-ribbon domain containing protein [Bacteroidetes bacterium]|nr:zinc-ribbon domain containing protein [Bacteroidota bacterium]
MFKDRLLTCSDCGKDFLFSVSEQGFYYKKNLTVPKRCPKCRLLRKMDYSPLANKGDK